MKLLSELHPQWVGAGVALGLVVLAGLAVRIWRGARELE